LILLANFQRITATALVVVSDISLIDTPKRPEQQQPVQQ